MDTLELKTIKTSIYKGLAKGLGIVLLLIGIGAVYGGVFSQSFIKEQLSAQNITMPDEKAIEGQVKGGRITQEDADALLPYAGEPMTNGNQAKVFADNYIFEHMKAAAAGAGVPDATYSTLGEFYDEQEHALIDELAKDNPNVDENTISRMAQAEIMNPLTTYESAQKAAQLDDLRQGTFFSGNTLRGMLLNAYGWGIVGTVALWAGIALIVLGLVLAVYGFMPLKKGTTVTTK